MSSILNMSSLESFSLRSTFSSSSMAECRTGNAQHQQLIALINACRTRKEGKQRRATHTLKRFLKANLTLWADRSIQVGASAEEDSSFLSIYHIALMRWIPLSVITMLHKYWPQGVCVADENGRLPLHYACKYHSHEAEVVEFLVEAFPESVLVKDSPEEGATAADTGRLPIHYLGRQSCIRSINDCAANDHTTALLTLRRLSPMASLLLTKQVQLRHGLHLEGRDDAISLLHPFRHILASVLVQQMAHIHTVSLRNLHVSIGTWNSVFVPFFEQKQQRQQQAQSRKEKKDCSKPSICPSQLQRLELVKVSMWNESIVVDRQISFEDRVKGDAYIIPMLETIFERTQYSLKSLTIQECRLSDSTPLINFLQQEYGQENEQEPQLQSEVNLGACFGPNDIEESYRSACTSATSETQASWESWEGFNDCDTNSKGMAIKAKSSLKRMSSYSGSGLKKINIQGNPKVPQEQLQQLISCCPQSIQLTTGRTDLSPESETGLYKICSRSKSVRFDEDCTLYEVFSQITDELEDLDSTLDSASEAFPTIVSTVSLKTSLPCAKRSAASKKGRFGVPTFSFLVKPSKRGVTPLNVNKR